MTPPIKPIKKDAQSSTLSQHPVMETKPHRIPLHSAETSYYVRFWDLINLGFTKAATIPEVAPEITVLTIIFAGPLGLAANIVPEEPPLKKSKHTQRIMVPCTMAGMLCP